MRRRATRACSPRKNVRILLRAIPYDIPGDPALAEAIVAEGKAQGLPAIGFHEPTHMLDYGTVIPMSYLVPERRHAGRPDPGVLDE